MEDMIRLAQAGNAIVTLSKRSAGAELNNFTKEFSEEMYYYTQGVQQRQTHLTLAHLLCEVSDQVMDGICRAPTKRVSSHNSPIYDECQTQ